MLRSRSGYMYISVLVTSLMVASISLATVMALRDRSIANRDATEATPMQNNADAALQIAVARIASRPNWRTDYKHGIPVTDIAFNGATLSFVLTDADRSLADDPTDPITITGIARKGSLTAAVTADYEPAGDALSCLSYAAAFGGNLTLINAADWSSDQTIHSNGNIVATASLTAISSAVSARGTITGRCYGTRSTGQPLVEIPNANALNYYRRKGTEIPLNSLTLVSGVRTISKVLLSPGNNPYGSTRNSEGVYWINCANQRVHIEDCRIVGTLVLINPGTNSAIRNRVLMEPAIANYPSLLVQGNMHFAHIGETFSEGTLGFNLNLNPPSTPFRGISNSTITDSYYTKITGLVFVTGNASFGGENIIRIQFESNFISNSTSGNGEAIFSYRPIYATYPPPGFRRSNIMQQVPGTYHRTIAQ